MFRNPALFSISGAGNELTGGYLRTRYSQPQSVLRGSPVCLASRTWTWKHSWLPKLCFNYKSMMDKIKKGMLRNIVHQRQRPTKLKTKVIRETRRSANLFTTNPTWTGMRSGTGLSGERTETGCPNHGKAVGKSQTYVSLHVNMPGRENAEICEVHQLPGSNHTDAASNAILLCVFWLPCVSLCVFLTTFQPDEQHSAIYFPKFRRERCWPTAFVSYVKCRVFVSGLRKCFTKQTGRKWVMEKGENFKGSGWKNMVERNEKKVISSLFYKCNIHNFFC